MTQIYIPFNTLMWIIAIALVIYFAGLIWKLACRNVDKERDRILGRKEDKDDHEAV
jgi:hypothetical protein